MLAQSVDQVREAFTVARKYGMKYHIDLPEITENSSAVVSEGSPAGLVKRSASRYHNGSMVLLYTRVGSQ
jgi:hypothetical protein